MATESDGMSGAEGSREPERARPKKAKPVAKGSQQKTGRKPPKAPPEPQEQSRSTSRKAGPGRRTPSTPAPKSETTRLAKQSPKGDDPRTDQQLLDDARGGKDGPLATLYTLHRPGLLKLVRRWTRSEHDALDIVQDSFLRLRSALRIRKLELRGSLRRYLSGVARGCFLKRLRTERKTKSEQPEEITSCEEPHAGSDTRDLLESLTAAHREILVLRILEGRSIAEVAKLLDKPEGTVKSRLSRALRAAEKKLES